MLQRIDKTGLHLLRVLQLTFTMKIGGQMIYFMVDNEAEHPVTIQPTSPLSKKYTITVRITGIPEKRPFFCPKKYIIEGQEIQLDSCIL